MRICVFSGSDHAMPRIVPRIAYGRSCVPLLKTVWTRVIVLDLKQTWRNPDACKSDHVKRFLIVFPHARAHINDLV